MALSSDPSPLVIAHRGGAGLRPENTLAAARHALDLGVDGIEVDVQLTADGVVVVHHDFTLNADQTRTADGRWLSEEGPPIASLSFEALQAYDVGRVRPGSRAAAKYPEQIPNDGERIAALEAFLELLVAADGEPRLWLELKTREDAEGGMASAEALAEASAALVEKYGLTERTAVLAFDWRVLKHLEKSHPALARCYLSVDPSRLSDEARASQQENNAFWAGFDPADYGGSLPDAVAAAGGPWWGPLHLDATPEAVARAHALGLRVSVWTVNTIDEAIARTAAGVDALTSDRPDLLIETALTAP